MTKRAVFDAAHDARAAHRLSDYARPECAGGGPSGGNPPSQGAHHCCGSIIHGLTRGVGLGLNLEERAP
jgi:hypothetical protein